MQSQWLLTDHHIYQVKAEIQMSKLLQFTMRTRTAESKKRTDIETKETAVSVRSDIKSIYLYIYTFFFLLYHNRKNFGG